MKIFYGCLLFIFLCPALAFSQLKDLKVKSFKVEDGMPENRITVLLQDKLGYIWAATQNGLVRYDGYRLKVYKLHDKKGALGFCSIYSLYEAPDGIIWVNVRLKGLYRYNKATDDFTQFQLTSARQKNLSVDFIENITDDGKGNLFMAGKNPSDKSKYIIVFNKSTAEVTAYGPSEKGNLFLPLTKAFSIKMGQDGRLWTSTDSILYYYDYAKKAFVKYLALPENNGKRFFADIFQQPADSDHLWITTLEINDFNDMEYEAVVKLNIKNNSYTMEGGKHVGGGLVGNTGQIIKGADKKLWFCTDSGLSVYDPVGRYYYNYQVPSHQGVRFATGDNKKNIWFGTDDGNLNYLNQGTGKITSYQPNELVTGGLPSSNTFETILCDKNGSLWMATVDNGLLQLDDSRSLFRYQTKLTDEKDNFPTGKIFSLDSRDGNLYWVVTQKGIYNWNKTSNRFSSMFILNKDKNLHFNNTCIDNDGIVWLSVYKKGLYGFDPKNNSLKNYRYDATNKEAISSNNINKLYADKEGLLWVGTDSGLCSLDKKTNKFIRYPFVISNGYNQNGQSLDDNRVSSIFEDKGGTIWVGTNLGGINRLDRSTGTFKSFHNRDGGFQSIVSIHEDRKGRLWAGSYLRGLFLVDKVKGPIKQFTEKDGLLYDGVSGMQEDKVGNIWINSPRGLSRFNPENFTFKNFTTATGLPESELNGSIDTAANGDIVVNTPRGIVSFDPYSINPNPYPPQVHIESLAYNDPTESLEKWKILFVDQNKSMELPHNQNRITYNFVALHFVNPSQNKYSYTLEGYDKQWSQPGMERSVTYNNLTPGTYIFHVIACNSDGVWNRIGDSFTIIISSPWWQRWWAWLVYFLLFATAIYTIVALRSRKLKIVNAVLEQMVTQRTDQLQQSTDQLQHSLEELKLTQQQLIQSEKMASLGELTAGIAHEIQNPLNFVNNFSEVSIELSAEMKEELKNGNNEEAMAIADDIEQNLEKINHHGKRADAIVKGMLQHSRSTTGDKQMTDINALTDEYFRLSYHGLRAKDKSFNAGMSTDFDSNLPKINIVSQDVGRVLLNLFNNAFYAVNQRKVKEGADYRPEVKVSTALNGKFVEIKVWDNGTGIPDAIKGKILQPFFTTKPTGEGTGLGLSLSYDIVVKSHGGKVDVTSKEGEFTEFLVLLPA